ncbi:diaminobutyrate--2-oxoglutarate transaminase [Nitrosopumilus sp. b1]|uniref:diaminobutyrate--2-oxoglutarate transaminase n=1 Tax=Nitrosopumilus sp. b1 TaxID=2109907 RepID=UPI0015F45E7B|nr:diaminobutyrate--2-oxoglutarate transaminase [Nitrosopumilus sp. b1]KAF6243843.1 diaminobutyrate--2-oxoglutarate transaminase [Nitrosopumilus sp. b1]
MQNIKKFESRVRSYSRAFPVTFKLAKDAYLYDEQDNAYLDFLCGAGSINYGHNNEEIKKKVIDYLDSDGIVHGLDLATTAKEEFLKTFSSLILEPRELNYKVQFTGPTGTNAVEAALKLARKVTGRTNIISFTNGFHGVSLGPLAATGNSGHRGGSGVPLTNVTFMPYDGYFGNKSNTIDYVRRFLEDTSSGVDLPAAFIVETIQGEGGINVAKDSWLTSLYELCKEFEILLIVDDIQVGCGRTGSFFSFEQSEITPDMVVLSKSLSGFGLPFSMLLLKPELDIWKPGEHNGTFRGNNLAFVSATETLKKYWSTQKFESEINKKSQLLKSELERIVKKHLSADMEVRGKGLIFGVDCRSPDLAKQLADRAFENRLILERCGSEDQVVKFMPPLTADIETIEAGLRIFEKSIEQLTTNSEIQLEVKKRTEQN